MKRILLPFAIVLSFLANAQIQKGTVLLGGTVYGESSKADGTNPYNYQKHSGIGISPSIGIATKENVVWGINASFSTDKNKSNQQTEYTTYTYYRVGIFTRRYLPLAKAFYLYGEGGLSYSKNKQQSPYYDMQTSSLRQTWGIGINAYPGIAYSISKRMQLELGLPNLFNAAYYNQKDVYKSQGIELKGNSEGFNVAMNLNPSTQLAVGFRILLSKQ